MCWYCGSAITDSEPIGRSLACKDCGKDLRVCRNCRHLRQTGCAESVGSGGSEKPSDPERANFCDWFSLNPKFKEATAGQKKTMDAAASARSSFDNLFK